MKGIYKRNETYWFQPATPDGGGKRAAPFSLRTKVEHEAVRRAVDWLRKGTVRVSRLSVWDREVEKYLADRLARGVQGRVTSRNARAGLALVGRELGFIDPARINERVVDKLIVCLRARNKLVSVRGGGPRVGSGKLSEDSVASYLRIFKAFCSWLVSEGILLVHPMGGMRHPSTKRTRVKVFYSKEERDLLLDGCEREDVRLIFLLGFYAGLRKGEMLAMNWDWIWLGEKKANLTVMESDHWMPKDKELREIPLHPLLRSELESLRSRKKVMRGVSEFVLRPDKGIWKEVPKDRVNLRRRCEARCSEVGLAWTGFHRLRHSFATHLAINGSSIAEIASLLGVEMSVAQKHYAGFIPGGDGAILGL